MCKNICTSGSAENTCVHATLQHTHKHKLTQTFMQAQTPVTTSSALSSPPSSLQLPCCYKPPLFPLSHVGVGSSQNTWIVYTVGLMKRYSAGFNTFLLCALFLEAGRNGAKFSASVTAAAGHCDEGTCDTTSDKTPVSTIR